MSKTVKIKVVLDDCVGKYGLFADINPEKFGVGVCEGCSFWNYCYTLKELKDELMECKKY